MLLELHLTEAIYAMADSEHSYESGQDACECGDFELYLLMQCLLTLLYTVTHATGYTALTVEEQI